MRKFATLFFLLFAIAVGSQVFAFEYEGLNYTVISPDDKTVSVSAVSGDLSGDVSVPEKVLDGETEYTVTEIAENGFRLCRGIKSFTMPNTVTKVGKDSFWGCMGMESITLSNNLESIGDFGFNSCSELKTIALPASLKTIGLQAFSNCTALESFTVDEENNNFASHDGVLFSKDKTVLIFYPNSKGIVYIVPAFVKTIGESAFFGCKSITKVIMTDNITSIETGAFYQCFMIKEIVLPKNLTVLNDWTFAYCGSLKSISLPEGITSIGDDAFAGCSMLEKIDFPEAVKSVGKQAFHSCISLSEVGWSKNITKLGAEAFSGCKKLKFMEISSPVQEVGAETFYGCSELKKLVLPSSVKSVSDAIILDCANLDTVVCHAVTPPTCSTWTFEGLPANCKLYVPAGTVDKYAAADGWNKFTNVVELETSDIAYNRYENVKVYTIGGKLAVEGITESVSVKVYGVDGNKVAEFQAFPGNNEFELNSGIYLVTLGDSVVKVIL